MLKQLYNNKPFLLASCIFLICSIGAIVFQENLLLLIPFAVLLIAVVFKYSIYNTEFLFWLLLIALPLSTEINITKSLGLDFPDEILMMLITGLVIVKIIYQPSIFPFHILKNQLFFILVLQFVWWVINCFYSQMPILSIKYLLAKIWFVVPFVVFPQFIISSQTHFKKIAFCLLLPMSFVVIAAVLRHSVYQFSLEGIKQSLSPFFRNHVNYSAMLVCSLAILWGLKKLTPSKNKNYKLIIIGLTVGLIALFFAYSRGAWVALFAGIATVFIIQKKWMLQTIISVIVSAIIMVVYLLYNNNYLKFAPDFEHTITHTNLSDHLQSTTTLKDLSNAERFYRWVAGTKMFAEKPVVGFGTNTFYSFYKGYTSDVFKTYVSDNPEHSSVHNYFLLLALEQGTIGLLLFCLLLFFVLMKTQNLYHQLHSNFFRVVTLVAAVVVVMIVCVNLMSDMIETDKIGSLFWLCVGTVILLENKLKEEKKSLA